MLMQWGTNPDTWIFLYISIFLFYVKFGYKIIWVGKSLKFHAQSLQRSKTCNKKFVCFQWVSHTFHTVSATQSWAASVDACVSSLLYCPWSLELVIKLMRAATCASLFQVNHVLESISAVHIIFVCLTLSVGSHFLLCFFFLKCPHWCGLHRDCFLLILRLVILHPVWWTAQIMHTAWLVWFNTNIQ